MIEILDKGGVVVYILLFYSVLGLTLIVYKYIHLLGLKSAPKNIENPNGNSPEARVLTELWSSLKNGIRDLDDVAIRVTSIELDRLEKSLKSISILASTAPLLGLLGTVLGMIEAFMVIEEAGGKVNASSLAGGIWEAMLTTAVGLSVALVLMIALHHLESLVEKRYRSLQHYVSLFFERSGAKHINCFE